jgi:hypothetical protein
MYGRYFLLLIFANLKCQQPNPKKIREKSGKQFIVPVSTIRDLWVFLNCNSRIPFGAIRWFILFEPLRFLYRPQQPLSPRKPKPRSTVYLVIVTPPSLSYRLQLQGVIISVFIIIKSRQETVKFSILN